MPSVRRVRARFLTRFPTTSSTRAGTRGPPGDHTGAVSAAQLWRLHLLTVLTPVHSLNLLLNLLAEHWLGYSPREDRHWFGVAAGPALCACCREASWCPREFAFAPHEHETFFGLLPLASQPAQKLLQGVLGLNPRRRMGKINWV